MENVKNITKKSARTKRAPHRTSELTAATNISGITFPSSALNERDQPTERMFENDYLRDKVDKLRKENEILLEWNRKAERNYILNPGEKLDIRQMYEQQVILIERLQKKASKQNRHTGNRLIAKEEFEEVECEGCTILRQQLTRKDTLVNSCRSELQQIKKQMAGYAMIRSQESAEEAELRNKIIAKLEKQLLDSRIEAMRLRDQLNEGSTHKPQTCQAQRQQELSAKLSLIRKSIQENNVDLRPKISEGQLTHE